jgi:RNA polymerase sigma-70 factor (ECF subfamily)
MALPRQLQLDGYALPRPFPEPVKFLPDSDPVVPPAPGKELADKRPVDDKAAALAFDDVKVRPAERTVSRFVALYHEQYGRVVAYAKRRLGNTEAAEDCAAEVFRIAWEHADQGVPDAGWLFVTARNTILHQQRSNVRTEALRQAAAADHSRRQDLQADEVEQVARVRLALDELPDDQRELLMAHYLDGLSGAECGALLGCSAGAVWVRLHRARSALRHSFEELSDLPDLPDGHDQYRRTQTFPKRVP